MTGGPGAARFGVDHAWRTKANAEADRVGWVVGHRERSWTLPRYCLVLCGPDSGLCVARREIKG